MEEINIKELFEFFLSRIIIVISITLVAILIGIIYSLFIQIPAYQSTTLVLTGIIGESSTNKEETVKELTNTVDSLTLNSKLISTYKEIIKSKNVLKDVINTLDLDCTAEELQRRVSVSNISGTEMISITVSSAVARESALIANEIANKFLEKVKAIYNIENISIIDEAEVQTTPININVIQQITTCAFVGLVLSLAIIFAMFYMDNTIKDTYYVEKLGLTVLATVPQNMEKGGKRK